MTLTTPAQRDSRLNRSRHALLGTLPQAQLATSNTADGLVEHEADKKERWGVALDSATRQFPKLTTMAELVNECDVEEGVIMMGVRCQHRGKGKGFLTPRQLVTGGKGVEDSRGHLEIATSVDLQEVESSIVICRSNA